MSRIRLESCSLEIDGRSLLAARPKAKVKVETACLVVPLAFVASAVKSQLSGFSLAVEAGANEPRIEFAGEIDMGDVVPDLLRRLMPESWGGELAVEGMLELRITPSGRMQVVVVDAFVAGLHVPKVFNIQRYLLAHVQQAIAGSPLLRKGSGDVLCEIDVPALARRAGVALDLPPQNHVEMAGDELRITFGATARATAKGRKAPARKAPARKTTKRATKKAARRRASR